MWLLTEFLCPNFPMPLPQFLAGSWLQRADIVLMCGRSLFSRAIRYATDSPFSHAALIFLTPDRQQGFEHTFLIEAVPRGVDLTRLDKVFVPPHGRDAKEIAFLRLEAPWFVNDVQALVRGRLLDFIEAGYDWRTVGSIALAVMRERLAGRAQNVPGALARALEGAKRRDELAPANFICSGLIQYGLLRALHDLAESSSQTVPKHELHRGLLNPRLAGANVADMLSGDGLATLLSTTPEEISHASGLTWKYLAVRGQVHAVSNREQAIRLITGPVLG